MNISRSVAGVAACLCPILSACPLYAQDAVGGSPSDGDACLDYPVLFDISSLEAVILRPERILEDVEAFWREDKAYQLMSVWHEVNDQPRNLDDWTRRIRAYATTPMEGREANPLLMTGRALEAAHPGFLEQAVPHICSFLPDAVQIPGITVYVAAEQMTSGIQVRGAVVMNIRSRQIPNLLVHELYHFGFNHARPADAGPFPRGGELARLPFDLQYEGMATYVGYRAAGMFPAPHDRDYQMLDDDDARKRLLRRVNSLFTRAGSYAPERLKKTAWRIGVQERAYYVVGAHMARTIDDRLGRPALVETIAAGPPDFMRVYNGLVPEAERVGWTTPAADPGR
jgi:hypothetical protein